MEDRPIAKGPSAPEENLSTESTPLNRAVRTMGTGYYRGQIGNVKKTLTAQIFQIAALSMAFVRSDRGPATGLIN
ncbi:hypothetical protein R1flu_013629 [Riccia fluitans]|uniref:Uncharacterized protein n=1 Tax=Riccia fluitans TaxID=41844 RepID=A0ABD1YE41_9MARC